MKKLISAFVIIFIALPSLWSQEKFALVIGNGAYTELSRLANPVNDAIDMSDALSVLGFTVDTVLDGNLVQMENAVLRLKNRLSVSKSAYGFFFYAGHGVQAGGMNYLIPVGVTIPSENFLRERAVSVQAMLSELNDAGNELNVVVLDACRDNPFSWARGGGRGLSAMSNQPADSIIVFATSAGSTAADGTGRNELFTSQLLKNIKTPGLEVKDVFNRTGADVSLASGRRQIPAIYNQFFNTAYLGTAPLPPSVFETGTVNIATGELEITTISAGMVQIIGDAVNRSVELPAWGRLPVDKINAGNYRVIMYYEDGKTEEKTVEVGRSESAKLEFSYRPVPVPAEPASESKTARKKMEPAPDAHLWTAGASVGSSFAAPLFIGTIHGTVAPFKYSFLELGIDLGFIEGTADIEYFSLHPFAHYALFLPFSLLSGNPDAQGGWYIGAGGGLLSVSYSFPGGDYSGNFPLAGFTTGFNIRDMFDISYTLRTNFSGTSQKVSVGYVRRFK